METLRKECSPNEIRLQKIAAEMGLAPPIIETDDETYMIMEKIPFMNVADTYGTTIRVLPHFVRQRIIDILRKLYDAGIQYVDITPYNFIETNDRMWVIDFGDAFDDPRPIHHHLKQIFETGRLRWNPDFK
jgi:tRNA A-37 threonylcarbamoyl transferase component Bud32